MGATGSTGAAAASTTINVQQLIANVNAAVSSVIQKDATTFDAYTQRQLAGMAQQAKWIAEGTAAGTLSDDLRDFFVDQLEDQTLVYAKTVAGLVMIGIEQIWNAVVGVLWSAINSVIDAAIGKILPVPPVPASA